MLAEVLGCPELTKRTVHALAMLTVRYLEHFLGSNETAVAALTKAAQYAVDVAKAADDGGDAVTAIILHPY